jgi:hypothetical protein
MRINNSRQLLCLILFGVPRVLTSAFVLPAPTTTVASSRSIDNKSKRVFLEHRHSKYIPCIHAVKPASLLENDRESMDVAYGHARTVLTILAIILVLMPDKTLTRRIATKWGGAAGFGMAAGVSNILKNANEHERLSSDTYKRINFGLLGFSVLGLAGCPGEAAFFPTAVPAMILSLIMMIVRLFTAMVAYRGWTAGIAENVTPAQELVAGTKSNLQGLKVAKKDKKKSLAYRNLLLLVFFGIVLNFMGGVFDIRVSLHILVVKSDS